MSNVRSEGQSKAAAEAGSADQRAAQRPSTGRSAAPSGWADRAESRLAGNGGRRGRARRAVLELLGSQECALTAQQIEECLRHSRRRVSRASVYRVLEQLEELALVQRVETGQAMACYERVCEAEEEHHHHLVCERCGVVIPFSDPALERAISRISERVPLAVSEHEIVLRGACLDCAAA